MARSILTWTEPDGNGREVTSYRIYRDGVQIATTSHQWFNDTGLTNGVAHSYEVSALNTVGEGELSVAVSATPMGLPAAPVVVGAAGDRSVNLTWAAPDAHGDVIAFYDIYRDGTLVTTTTHLWFEESGLVNGAAYTYRVAAESVNGTGALSAPVTVIPAGVPGGLR